MFSVQRLSVGTLLSIERQPSQRMQLGYDATLSIDDAEAMAQQDDAWACYDDDRLIACIGIHEGHPGRQGVAWAILAEGVGRAHLALTRFARDRIMASPLPRVEVIARAADAEAILQTCPGADAEQLLHACMAMATPECAWARLVGMTPAHVLRKFGGLSETHILFERIR